MKKTGIAKTGQALLVLIVIVAACIYIGSQMGNHAPAAPGQVAATPEKTPADIAAEAKASHNAAVKASNDRLAAIQAANAARKREETAHKLIVAWVMATSCVKDDLVSPGTAKFHGGGWSPYVKYLGDNRYMVTAYVDSQNGFGAMLRTHFQAVVRDKKDEHQTWVLESLNYQ